MTAIKRDKLDAIVSDLCRERAGWKSEYSGETGHLECCHIYGRRRKSVRWHPWNVVCLTHYEHRMFTENPILFANWCNAKFGPDRMLALCKLANTPLKLTPRQIEGLYQFYRAELTSMQALRADGAAGRLEFDWPEILPEFEPRKRKAKKPASKYKRTLRKGTVLREVA